MFLNSGWANNCGVQLFTIGWVPCDVAIPAVGLAMEFDVALPVDWDIVDIFVPGRDIAGTARGRRQRKASKNRMMTGNRKFNR